MESQQQRPHTVQHPTSKNLDGILGAPLCPPRAESALLRHIRKIRRRRIGAAARYVTTPPKTGQCDGVDHKTLVSPSRDLIS